MKKKTLLSSIVAIVLCLSLMTGASFALFTSEASVNVAITSATVKITASVDDLAIYSMDKPMNGDTFENGGTAKLDNTNLTLTNVTPGDKVEFKINIKNASNVMTKYRLMLVESGEKNDDGVSLVNGLKLTVTDKDGKELAGAKNGNNILTAWANLDPVTAETVVETLTVSLELPADAGNEYQSLSSNIAVNITAVQANAEVEDPAEDAIMIFTADDLLALSGKYLVSNNNKAETANVELMSNIDLNGAEFKEIGVAYGDTLNFNGNGYTISNMKLATGEHNGMTNVGMFYADTGATLNVKDLTLSAPVVADGVDTYTTGAAAVIGYANGVVNLTNVDVENASVNNTYGNAAIYVGYTVNKVTLTNCDVKNSVATGEVENEAVRADKTGAFVGTANTSGCVFALNNCTNTTALTTVGRVINGAILVIDGEVYAYNAEGVTTAINAGYTTINLAAGNFVMPAACQGKTLTFKGSEGTTVEVKKVGTGGENCDYAFDGSNVTFEGITFTTNSSTYIGYARLTGTYNKCTFNGTYTLYRDSVFTECTFNVTGDVYNVWTWGAPNATFTGCTFNSDGKALLLYGTANTNLTVNGCTFNDKGGLSDKKAAIEIGNDYGKSYTLVVNNTTVNGYEINDKGINTGSTLWGNKNSMAPANLSVTVDGTKVY